MPANLQDLIPVLLLIILSCGILLTGLVALLARHWFYTRRPPNWREYREEESSNYLPEAPSRWLAIRSTDIFKVQRALGLKNPAPCSWSEGLSQAHEHRLFVSPSIQGWILVFGEGLPGPAEDIDRLYQFLHNLSSNFEQAQYFAFDRVLQQYGWARMSGPSVLRGFVWTTETAWNEGTPSDAERRLGMPDLPYGSRWDALPFEVREQLRMSAERIFELAGSWSIDPTRVGANLPRPFSPGLAGELQSS